MGKIIQGYDGSRHASSSGLASKNKLRGHKLEEVYAERVNGDVVRGQGKVDVNETDGTKTSCKGAKKHIQILLQSKDNSIAHFGEQHPISMFIKSGYRVKRYKVDNNNKVDLSLKNDWRSKADDLSNWLHSKNNFKVILSYVFGSDKIDNLVVFEDVNDCAYKFKLSDIVEFYTMLDYEVYVTKGCKVVVKSKIPKISENRKLVIFNFELRGSVGKIGSINYWNDAQRFYKTIKANLRHIVINP